jgi:hypothetical protein
MKWLMLAVTMARPMTEDYNALDNTFTGVSDTSVSVLAVEAK